MSLGSDARESFEAVAIHTIDSMDLVALFVVNLTCLRPSGCMLTSLTSTFANSCAMPELQPVTTAVGIPSTLRQS